MKDIFAIQLDDQSGQEKLPDFSADFPYLNSRAFLNQFRVLWHWHNAVELFYVESGSLEYETPGGKIYFPVGSGGLVNSGILHTSRPCADSTVQRLHIFDTSFLAGISGGLIERKYFAPITENLHLEILPLFPDVSEHQEVLCQIKSSFDNLSTDDFGYEMKLRERLSEIWLKLFHLSPKNKEKASSSCETVKRMIAFVQRSYSEHIAVSDIASSGMVSERECYRIFREFLQTSPGEYLRDYRLNAACRMLSAGKTSVTQISLACGFGSSSFFGKVFLAEFGITPTAYRAKWQDMTK